MTVQDEVISKWPKAFVHRIGVMKYEIRRPREKTDPPALVKYVLISQLCDSPEKAWENAGRIG